MYCIPLSALLLFIANTRGKVSLAKLSPAAAAVSHHSYSSLFRARTWTTNDHIRPASGSHPQQLSLSSPLTHLPSRAVLCYVELSLLVLTCNNRLALQLVTSGSQLLLTYYGDVVPACFVDRNLTDSLAVELLQLGFLLLLYDLPRTVDRHLGSASDVSFAFRPRRLPHSSSLLSEQCPIFLCAIPAHKATTSRLREQVTSDGVVVVVFSQGPLCHH